MDKTTGGLTFAAAVLTVFAVLVVLTVYHLFFPPAGDATTKDTTTPSTATKCNTLLYPPVKDETKFAVAINGYIMLYGQPRSPLNGLGSVFLDAGKKFNINPAYVINIARKESSFGLYVPPGSYNPYGRTATESQPHVDFNGRLWYRSDSWAASATDESDYLKVVYADLGLITVEQITYKYAPPGENNTEQYIKQMNSWINEVIKMAGDSLECQ